MKSLKILIAIFLLILVTLLVFYFSQRSGKTSIIKENLSGNMKLLSSVFENNQSIPPKYTCDGENVNPPLEIKEMPEGAETLVLIVDDPDAPGGTFVHWIVWNIPPSISLIKENSAPEGAIQGINDFGKNSYSGPCPPSGTHHYHFKLYALDQSLVLDSAARKEDLEKAMETHILEQAELIGLYQR